MLGKAGVLEDLLAILEERTTIGNKYRRPKYLYLVSCGIAVSYVYELAITGIKLEFFIPKIAIDSLKSLNIPILLALYPAKMQFHLYITCHPILVCS